MTTTEVQESHTTVPSTLQSFDKEVIHYERAIDALGEDTDALFPALLARDKVEQARNELHALSIEQANGLIALDQRLRQYVVTNPPRNLSIWRQSLSPSTAAWWWWLDQEVKQDLLWVVATSVFVMLSISLALEIIKRLWDGAPDTVSVFGTLLALLLTGSPLLQQGQAVSSWLLHRIPWVVPHFRAQAMCAMAFLAFSILFIGRVGVLPQLARSYNNTGFKLEQQNIAAAQQAYERAVALNPDLVVPYYNLAEIYRQTGLFNKALTWYEATIEHNKNFGPAYRSLGHLYNLQGEPVKAEQILVAGLDLPEDLNASDQQTIVTRYMLLADLGWAYFAQENFERTQAALEEAVSLEKEVEVFNQQDNKEYRIALPHYYLAQVYEQLDRRDEAKMQWETSLRLLNPTAWQDREQLAVTCSHLQQFSPSMRCNY